jgi:glycine/serine hydroxymethyltransferase
MAVTLTHGSPVNFSGKLYRTVLLRSGRKKPGLIDYDALRELALAKRKA